MRIKNRGKPLSINLLGINMIILMMNDSYFLYLVLFAIWILQGFSHLFFLSFFIFRESKKGLVCFILGLQEALG
jgi:hypothetical protein